MGHHMQNNFVTQRVFEGGLGGPPAKLFLRPSASHRSRDTSDGPDMWPGVPNIHPSWRVTWACSARLLSLDSHPNPLSLTANRGGLRREPLEQPLSAVPPGELGFSKFLSGSEHSPGLGHGWETRLMRGSPRNHMKFQHPPVDGEGKTEPQLD